MKTITFFSYKGGVGRTLAASNFAVYLAKLGLKVVIIDFDLDAPGVDSKFPGFKLPSGQLGIIDYILAFQRDGSAPGSIDEIVCEVCVPSTRQDYSLAMIPAGDYLASDYSSKLNELNWSRIFSNELDGVAFFQLFIKRIRDELAPDVLIIDSRTGFSEIGGLCTQQLADETVILSSLANESIKMTRHLAELIQSSDVAQSLGKVVTTKIVVSRVPKPSDIDTLKAECCRTFNVPESRLFFLFSCPTLERNEFVAMLDTSREDSLVASYVQLFQGLDVEVAQESIKEQIERAERGLLSCTPQEAESRIREMVALYPHPEVYRRAMRFFNLTRRQEDAAAFGVRLLDLLPDDEEATTLVSTSFLRSDLHSRRGISPRALKEFNEVADKQRLISIAKRAQAKHWLTVTDSIRLADFLEDDDDFEAALEISLLCLESEIQNPQDRFSALEIAARTAYRTGEHEQARQLIVKIPPSRLTGSLARIAVEQKAESEGPEKALEFAKLMIARAPSPPLLMSALQLSQQLGCQSEFEDFVKATAEEGNWDPEALWFLERQGMDIGRVYPPGVRSSSRSRHLHSDE